MENDYLWDKTGEDAEIERLESALQVFRYQENKAPVLPAKVLVSEPRFSIFSWRLAFTFAVILTLLFGGVAVWFKLRANNEALLMVANPAASKTFAASLVKVESKQPEKLPLPLNDRAMTKPKFINTAFRPTEVAQVIQLKRKAKPKIQLTKEEKDAFNQLMLALSITGSQLKEVQDKVNGFEEHSSDNKLYR